MENGPDCKFGGPFEVGGSYPPLPTSTKHMDIEDKRRYDREYHANRSADKKLRKQRLQKERVGRNLLVIRAYKANKGCADCGEKDPIVLDFDHRDRKTKKFKIGDCTRLGWSLNKIIEEAGKCDVVCANCHRRRTAKQLKWR